MPKKLTHPKAVTTPSHLPGAFSTPEGGWQKWIQEYLSIPDSIFTGFQGPYADLQVALVSLADQVDDREVFLELAKTSWEHVHYKKVRRRGRLSVGDQCIAAIKAGHDALGLPDAEFWMDGQEGTVFKNENYQRLPLGRLEQMILERVPGVTPSTARKYARLWDRRGRTLAPPGPDRRELGMDLYKETKKVAPGLYKTRSSK